MADTDTLICTAHYYLSDITEDLCPTWVIPGSRPAKKNADGLNCIFVRPFLSNCHSPFALMSS